MSAVRLVDASFRYADRDPWIVENLSLDLAPGERVAIFAPSGSGKTTLLSIIGGIVPPTLGRVEYSPDVVARRIAWVQQDSNVIGRYSALDNVALGGLARGLSPSQSRIAARAWLTSLRLHHVADRPARTLSGGQRQRLCIARALLTDPAVILMDEPTAQLDEQTTLEVHALIGRAISASRVLFVIASHDRRLAAIATRVFELVDGRLREAR